MIFIDHVPGNLYSSYTYRMIGFSDAAEAFVLISGIAAGLAYSRQFDTGEAGKGIRRISSRMRTIYLAHVLSSLLVLLAIALIGLWLPIAQLQTELGVDWLLKAPAETLAGLFLLTYQLGFFNILPLYIVLFLMLPLLLFVGVRNLWLMLGGSFTLWLATRYFNIELPAFPKDWAWFFNPFCWQLLFAIGLACGIAAKRGKRLVPVRSWLIAVSLVYIVFSAWWRLSGHGDFPWPDIVPDFLVDRTKLELEPARLLHILAFAYLVSVIPSLNRVLSAGFFDPIRIMGQASLATFVSGSLVAVALQLWRVLSPTTLAEDTLLLVAGLLVQYLVARAALQRAGKLLPRSSKNAVAGGC